MESIPTPKLVTAGQKFVKTVYASFIRMVLEAAIEEPS